MTWLIRALVGRVVQVQAEGLKVYGRLVAVSDSQRRPVHLPGVLILETDCGFCIVREWTVIAFSGRL